MSRVDQYAVAVIVDNVNLGIFDTFSGGLVTSEETKHRSGAMGAQMSYGGPRTIENVTVTRKYDQFLDVPRRQWLEGRAGKGQAVVVKQLLDINGNVFGAPEVYQGILLSVKTPDSDSNSTDIGMLTLEISTHGFKG